MFSGPLTPEDAASTPSQNMQETASDSTQYPTRMKTSVSYIYSLFTSRDMGERSESDGRIASGSLTD